jgi:FKBP-type peptidyl-prolyl cis-trans isomerase
MRTILSACVLLLVCYGCVAGPEEIAADKAKKEALAPQHPEAEKAVAEHEHADDKSVSTASHSDDGKGAFQKTNNGLKYRIINEGTGARPNKNSTVVCHYRGWLDNGKEFDSSYSGSPAEFPLTGVIAGWTEGVPLIKEGGKIELEVPSRLGYGEQGHPPVIPANARLHFEIELIKVK